MNPFRSRSLRWRLVSRFTLVLGLMMIALNIGFTVYVLFAVSDSIPADNELTPMLTASLDNQGGRLAVVPNPALAAILEQSPEFWFVAVNDTGATTSFGAVPDQYATLKLELRDLKYLDVRGPEHSPLTATFVDIPTDTGSVRVLYGGRTMQWPFLSNIVWGMRLIYIPFITVPLLVAFIAIPLIVGRALRGIDETTRLASSIGATTLGVRLPTDGMVKELDPLVNAINLALSRIDSHVAERQRFFTSAAHELRTPIAILQTRVETLQPSAEKARLLSDVGRLAATAEQLLDQQRFAALQSWEPLDLVVLCQTVVSDMAPLAIAAGYDLEFDAKVPEVIVTGDAASLERALTNLIRNAVDHAGGQGKITIEVFAGGTIEVSDEGPGVAPEHASKIFEPFFRIRPRPTGAGLGLSLVQQIAKAHNGQASALPQPKGARFRLTIGPTPT